MAELVRLLRETDQPGVPPEVAAEELWPIFMDAVGAAVAEMQTRRGMGISWGTSARKSPEE